MWPWGHLAVGYLLYSLGLRHRNRLPDASEAYLVAFGTLFPDLVDKPMAWSLGVLESGRSLGHSVLIAVLVLGVLYVVIGPQFGQSRVFAFAVGYLSHPLADLPFEKLAVGDLEFATYLVWPMLPPPPHMIEQSFIAHLAAYELGPFEAFQWVLFGLAIILWYLDGLPGLEPIRARVTR